MKELRSIGHLHLIAKKNGSKFDGHSWFWFEKPVTEEEFKKSSGQGGFQEPQENGDSEYMGGNIRRPISKNTNLKKNTKVNEESMTFPKKKIENPRDFLVSKEEKKYFDQLVKFMPSKGDKLDQKSVSWWIKTYGIERVKKAVLVYNLQVEKSLKNSSVPTPDNMGGYVCTALKDNTQPENEESNANKAFATDLAEKHSFLGIYDKYVRVSSSTMRDEMHYTRPKEMFESWLLSKLELAEAYS
jgi:hypothetical protein